jgi:phosphotransferase system HPr (HPr) family protein
MLKKTITILEEEGLHARPASALAKVAMQCKCNLKMYLKMYREDDMSKIYQPKSILSIMSLGAGQGDRIVFEAEGEGEEEALLEIERTVLGVVQV